ncbi:cystatin-like isoform X1 [Xiphophorus hellerii]|uniref:cystatin-like isoform X1 n=1 Tax=Xiphophorus hellerii TaxID=8084 RepID=UPI0013B430DA|nr:cystatin-like isoform X1 [Xiphophorus hellerii]
MSLPLSLLICLSVFQLCLGAPPVEEVITEKKVHLLGAWTERLPESKDVQKAAQYAVEMFNKNSKDEMLFKLVSITSAKSQVTNRINFKIDAVLGRTKCPTMENLDLKSCILDEEQLQCQFVVTLDPGNEEHELKTKKCHKVAKRA